VPVGIARAGGALAPGTIQRCSDFIPCARVAEGAPRMEEGPARWRFVAELDGGAEESPLYPEHWLIILIVGVTYAIAACALVSCKIEQREQLKLARSTAPDTTFRFASSTPSGRSVLMVGAVPHSKRRG
jgi:hypothetical protein